MMTAFSPDAHRLLTAAGWRDDRCVDLTEYERALSEAGYPACEPVSAFLRRYGDLEIETIIGDMDFNTLLSPILQYPVSSEFSDAIGQVLYIIGDDMFHTITMDASGRVYRNMRMTSQNVGGIDLYRIGDTGEEALEKIIMELALDIVPPGEWVAHRD